MWRLVLAAALGSAGCLGAQTEKCPGGGVCPVGTVCRVDRDVQLCVPELCGNGALESGEDCDDGNNTSGDGCEATCRVAHGPNARYSVAMTYDTVHNKIVLFGGQSMVTHGDTWVWNGAEWEERELSTSPPARRGANMIFDRARGRVLLFGGRDALDQPFGDLWAWDDTAWTQLDPGSPAPSPRVDAHIAYDTSRNVVVLFGGLVGTGVAATSSDETWELDGTRWAQAFPSQRPSPRWGGAMVFHEARGETVLVGGMDDDTTWMWNGTRWTTLPGSGPPTQFHGAGMAFEQGLLRPVFYGGMTYPDFSTFGGTWELEGPLWVERMPEPSPPPREAFGMAWVEERHAIMVFGGLGPEGVFRGDLWSFENESWTEWQ